MELLGNGSLLYCAHELAERSCGRATDHSVRGRESARHRRARRGLRGLNEAKSVTGNGRGGERPVLDAGHRAVVIIGGGQAGLAMSYCLRQRGIDHAVLERHRVGYEWRARRWDSFCLVTPNWQC